MDEKMDPEIKKKWVSALRSGKYPQNHGALRYEGSFCALGVLCDVVLPSGWEAPHYDPKYPDSTYTHCGRREMPGAKLFDVAKLSRDRAGDVIVLNDEEELSFDEIADFIEKEL